eukprot:TRINITY_DN264_c3_g1_i1.p1 TRINITY_DN264_c3_g1~~TRINITY_DN264_c3_g1_i1.p1  ORF type:complete len:567 (+),score=24.67 TRINITY_DN264_c3_g1_i1:42-1703(+)
MRYTELNPLIKMATMLLFLCLTYNALFGRSQTDYLKAARDMLRGSAVGIPSMGDFAEDVKDSVDSNMKDAMREIFDELDSNKDGVIEYSEFTGMGLNTWAAFRALDLVIKSRLSMPTFSGMRQTIRENLPQFSLPEELRLLRETNWVESLRSKAAWYILFLVYVQCSLCAWENILGFLGLKSFTYPKNPDVSKVKTSDKETCLQYDTPLQGWYELTKTLLMTISGLPILRLIQAMFFVTVGMIAVNISVMVPNKFWKGFWLRGVTSLCISGALFSFGFYRVGIEGTVADRSECKILIGNHTAVFEILIMFGLSFPAFISAVENARVPLFSGVVRACDAILVDRLDKNSRKHTMHEIKKRAKTPDAPQLMIYPEGTLNNQKGLFMFKTGAFEPGQPVQPICFKYPYKHYNPCWTGEATGGNDVGEVGWRVLCQIVNRVEVKILPVYRPSEAETEDKYLYSSNVRKVMAANLRTDVSDCVYEDYVALNKIYSRLKRIESRSSNASRRSTEYWFPFIRKNRAKVADLLKTQHVEDECQSMTSCEDTPNNTPLKTEQ